jgi:hypothetical protein
MTPQNCAIALIDYQLAMYQGGHSHGRLVPSNSVQVLAKAAKPFGIPPNLLGSTGYVFRPVPVGSHRAIPDHKAMIRTSMKAWIDANFRRAADATGRKRFAVTEPWP